MAIPSSQVLASWLLEDVKSREWSKISTCLENTLSQRLPNISATQISDIIDLQTNHIVNHIITKFDMTYIDGSISTHEIDDNDPPYIRFVGEDVNILLNK